MSRRLPNSASLPLGPQSLRMDLLSLLIAANVMLIANWLYTQVIDQNAGLAFKLLFAPIFLFSGLLMGGVIRQGFSFMWHYLPSDWLKISGGTVISVALIAIVGVASKAVFPSLAATGGTLLDPIQTKLFYMNMGAAEEFFFNYFLFALLLFAFLRWRIGALTPIAAAGVTAGFFLVYHLAVYGSDPSLLFYTLSARIILCMTYYFTKNLSAAILPHMIINLMVS